MPGKKQLNMFTGIIEEVGRITGRKYSGGNMVVSILGEKIFEDIKTGDSISVNGVCLTVEKLVNKTFTATVSPETLSRTNLGGRTSDSVNLERALKYGDRVGGHFLSGHVDFQTKILTLDFNGKTGTIKIFIPAGYRKYLFPKSSIGIDGISLTVAEIKADYIIIWIIPHTLDRTNIFTKKAGDTVNVEIDMTVKAIAKTKLEHENRKISKSAYL
ncbi:MAG: riboflavin synthase [Candidatus Omnitrophica bacterium]|nr:riboflavin synthase [Candidatus Omnitrophota bacterium]